MSKVQEQGNIFHQSDQFKFYKALGA